MIESDLRRLICYDAIFLKRGASGKADATPKGDKASPKNDGKSDRSGGRFVPEPDEKPVEGSGKTDKTGKSVEPASWKQVKLNGRGAIALRVRSLEQHRNIVGQKAPLELTVSCRANTTTLAVTFGGNIVASVLDRVPMTLQIDQGSARAITFAVSRDFKAVALPTGIRSIPVIKTMIGASRLQLSGAPFFSKNITAQFDIRGLAGLLQPLRQACNW